MAIVLTNGKCYIAINETGGIIKTPIVEEAKIFRMAMGGEDSMDNLQASCFACNQFKNNILPDAFMDRIVKIFSYQMEKKSDKSLKAKIIHRLVKSLY